MASDEVPAGWVRLSVRGRIIVTMKQTLRASPFFARLFETDDRMPDATAGSPTHFIDRNPDRFTKVLDYLGDGKLFADKNYNLEELRLEADFYGLDTLVKAIDEARARNESRSTTKCVVVSRKDGGKSIEIAVSPRENMHFLLCHLKQRYPCRVSAPTFLFPFGSTVELKACRDCPHCAGSNHCKGNRHLCGCSRGTTAMLKDVESSLESHGYVLDHSVQKAISEAARSAASWTFVKREG